METLRRSQLGDLMQGGGENSEACSVEYEDERLAKAHYESRLAALEEIRELIHDKVMRSQEER